MENLFEQIKANVDWYEIVDVKQLESDEDCNGEEILRFSGVKDYEPVTIEYYTNGNSLDIFFSNNEEEIYQGALKTVMLEPIKSSVNNHSN